MFKRKLVWGVVGMLISIQGIAQSVSISSGNSVCLNELISFTASSSGTISSYDWDLGDNSSSTQSQPIHTYSTYGTKIISLEVTFSDGTKATDSKQIEVHDLPTAKFSVSSSSSFCLSQHELCLIDSSSMGATTTGYQTRLILWGDGAQNTNNTPANAKTICYKGYTGPGTYSLVVEVVNDKGCEDKWFQDITILQDYTPSFKVNVGNADCESRTICFENDSSTKPSDVVKWEYDFGDGTTSTNGNWNNQCHKYTTTGNKNVTFTVTMSNGCVNTYSKNVGVNFPKVEANVILNDSVNCFPNPFLVRTPSVSGASYNWKLYDSDTNFIQAIGYRVSEYASPTCPGDYFVQLNISLGQCHDTSRLYKISAQGIMPSFTALNDNQCQAMDTTFFINTSKYHPDAQPEFLWRMDDANAPGCSTSVSNCNYDVQEHSQHFYSDTGCYEPSLVITDPISGCIDSTVALVVIQDLQDVEYYHSIDRPCIGRKVEYGVGFNVNKCGIKSRAVYDSASYTKFGDFVNRFNYVNVADDSGWVTVGFEAITGSAKVYRSADTSDYYVDSNRLCIDTFWYHNWFRLHPEPKMYFNLTQSTGCVPSVLTAEYVGNEEKKIKYLRYLWGMNDPLKAIELYQDTIPSVSTLVKEAGTFAQFFMLEDTFGCYSYLYPVHQFGYINELKVDSIVCPNTPILFRDSIRYFDNNYPYWKNPTGLEKLTWDFDDGHGFVDSGHFPIYTFTTNGVYTVRMATRDINGCTDTLSQRIYVGGISADIFKNDKAYLCDQIIQFRDSSYFWDPNITQPIKEYFWDFGDFTTNSYLKDPFHYFTSNGDYTITHAVTTEEGCTDTARIQISIRGPEPYFDITSDTIGCVPFEASFKSTSINVSELLWHMGDSSNTVIAANGDTTFSFIYDKPGVYDIYLTGSDSFYNADANNTYTCRATFPDTNQMIRPIRRIVVLPYPQVSFTVAEPICQGQFTEFVSTSDSIYSEFNWKVDGQDLNEKTDEVSHVFNTPGKHNITLHPTYDPAVENIPGCFDSASIEVEVSHVVADFVYKEVGTCNDYLFTDRSENAASLLWDFGDPMSGFENTSKEEKVSHSFGTQISTFTICLTATNEEGCVDSACTTLETKYAELLIPYNIFTPNDDDLNDSYLFDVDNTRVFRLSIFNRWGECVFSTNTPEKGWNGNYQNDGKELPNGTYFYVLDYAFECDEKLSKIEGQVQLVR